MIIYKELFSNEFCDYLIPLIKTECILSESHKTGWFVWLIWGEQGIQKLSKEKWNIKIVDLVNKELKKSNLEIQKYELKWLQMTEYENNRWLRKHVDGDWNKTLIILLSDEFVGGETFINDKEIELKKGDGVLFDGHLMYHEIKPVISGKRNALNFWFKNTII